MEQKVDPARVNIPIKHEFEHVDHTDPEHTLDGDMKEPLPAIPAPLGAPERLTIVQAFRKYPWPAFLCFLGAFSAISDGYQIQMSGSIIALPGFIIQFGSPQRPSGKYVLDPYNVAIWGAMKSVFSIVGAGLATWPNDRFGRKPMILSIQIAFIGACLLEMFATKPNHWLGARILDGFANGINASVLNVYVAEMAPTAARGALLAMYSIWYAMGQLVCVVALNIVQSQPTSHWRHAIYSQWALVGVCLIIWFFLPESPRWLCQKERHEEAQKILSRVYRAVGNYDLQAEYAIMKVEVESARDARQQGSGGSYRDLLRSPNLRRLFISFVPYAWQVALGVPVVLSYSSYFFQLAGLANPFLGTLASNLVLIISLVVSLYVLERVGRRRPLLIGGGICILCVIGVGSVLKATGPGVGAGLIVFNCLWTAAYALSAGPIGYIYTAETANARLRAKTTGFAIIGVQAWQIIFTYSVPLMLNNPVMGLSNTAYFFSGTGLLGWVAVYFFVPEFKGRSYSEIDELFHRKVSARKFHLTATSVDVERRETAAIVPQV